MNKLRDLYNAWCGARAFTKRPNAKPSIVLYSEGRPYEKFFRPIIANLVGRLDRSIDYITSDLEDSFLKDSNPSIRAYYIGGGGAMIYALQNLRAKVLVSTTPDLNRFHIKRSVHPVHYAYIHHSMVSTHMIYRKGAFDAFDTILCVGPHHMDEIREWEKLNDLPGKRLFEHGYAPLDSILEMAKGERVNGNHPAHEIPNAAARILIAPSWGPNGILETIGGPLTQVLLDGGYHVTVRPHPRTRQISPGCIDAIGKDFASDPKFVLESDTNSFESLFSADLMISDWSGVAMEFAFGLNKPVIFIDTPPKVNNPDYQRLRSKPLEITCRPDVGVVVAPEKLADIPGVAAGLLGPSAGREAEVTALRDRMIFNVGRSGEIGAEIIAGLADK